MDLIRQVIHDLRRHEGCRLRPYRDSVGVWTNGFGNTKNVTENTPAITEQQALDQLIENIAEAVTTAKRVFKTYSDLDPVRKSVAINMAFNLGESRLRQFKKFLAAVEGKNWTEAALQMLDSKWSRQVGQRATELAARMSSGKIPSHRLYQGE